MYVKIALQLKVRIYYHNNKIKNLNRLDRKKVSLAFA
jgi:hypothetical protein